MPRLHNIREFHISETHPELRNLPWDEGGEWVRLYFTDRGYYRGYYRGYSDTLDWPWSRLVPRSALTAHEKRRVDPDGCVVDVRYFTDSPYLARHIVACAGTCTTDDPRLLEDIRTYLASLPGA